MDKDVPVNEKIDQAYKEYAQKHYDKNIKQDITTFLSVIVGSALIAANIAMILEPGNLISAGFSGVVMLIQKVSLKWFNVSLPFTPLSFILNIFPAILCYKSVGKKFTIYSFLSVIITAVLIDIIPHYVITTDRLLISVFGGIINGFGCALILRSGASSGGADFISIFYSVKKGINTFNATLAANCVLILAFGLMFGMDNAMYTIIFQYVSTQVINLLYTRFSKKTVFIVTKLPHEVADVIMSSTHHSCTIFNSVQGSYSGEERHVVYTIVTAADLPLVKKLVKGTDPKSFINIVNSESVSGMFFNRPFN